MSFTPISRLPRVRLPVPLLVLLPLLVLFMGLFLRISAFAQDTPEPSQIASSANTYRLAGGDVIDVKVYGEDDLTMVLSVPKSGSVAYAFIGDFELAGKTVSQVQEEIHQRLLGDYLLEPRVTVSVAAYRDIYVYGSVARPGSYPWAPGLTVRRAISLAGGLKERASTSKWYVVAEGGGEADRRKANEDDLIMPGDSLTIEESFF